MTDISGGERPPPAKNRKNPLGFFPLELICEAFSAFEAAALQDEAAGVGGVALHETMLSFALALVGLIRTFRHKIEILYSLFNCNYLVYYSRVFHE